MIAFSFGKNLGDAYQLDKKGKKTLLVSFLYPKFFKLGLAFLTIGFFYGCQLIKSFKTPIGFITHWLGCFDN